MSMVRRQMETKLFFTTISMRCDEIYIKKEHSIPDQIRRKNKGNRKNEKKKKE